MTKIKELGYLVKLDTNGYRPEILKKLVEEKKIDYVAMDIKNAPSRYGETAGVRKIDVMRINESVEFLKSGVVDYEFRTTLCKELHGREEIEAIGKWLSGAKRYFLQNYRESDYVIDPRFSGYAREQLERFCEQRGTAARLLRLENRRKSYVAAGRQNPGWAAAVPGWQRDSFLRFSQIPRMRDRVCWRMIA